MPDKYSDFVILQILKQTVVVFIVRHIFKPWSTVVQSTAMYDNRGIVGFILAVIGSTIEMVAVVDEVFAI